MFRGVAFWPLTIPSFPHSLRSAFKVGFEKDGRICRDGQAQETSECLHCRRFTLNVKGVDCFMKAAEELTAFRISCRSRVSSISPYFIVPVNLKTDSLI